MALFNLALGWMLYDAPSSPYACGRCGSAIREMFPSPRPDDEAVPRGTTHAIISGPTAKDDLPVNRMVIDIRDGYLEIPPWLDSDVVAKARRVAQQADLSGETFETTVEAATLACAARQAGRPAARQARRG
ncbi:DUF6545 domain-containing protein [Micromonospora sp. NPDC004551]|uniref:DUF6545 domain-containing protein n=1 Tax=Micromonospora sp. NPDC004551 TaxID=3154284 RepID=UPI0033AA126A